MASASGPIRFYFFVEKKEKNCMWLAHALENLPIYSYTHQKEKPKIMYIQKLFDKHN
jgi:hypothetical protein